MDTDDFADDDVQWSDPAREQLRSAAAGLQLAISQHSKELSGIAESANIIQLGEINGRLLDQLLAYANAQMDLTGNNFPIGLLRSASQVDLDSDSVDLDSLGESTTGVSVFSRKDYEVTDEQAIMNAATDVMDRQERSEETPIGIGYALYLLAHARTWEELDLISGLQRTGGVTRVIAQADLLMSDPDNWPVDAFIDANEQPLLFEQKDVFME